MYLVYIKPFMESSFIFWIPYFPQSLHELFVSSFLFSVIVKALDYFSTALEINFLDNDGFNYQVKCSFT